MELRLIREIRGVFISRNRSVAKYHEMEKANTEIAAWGVSRPPKTNGDVSLLRRFALPIRQLSRAIG